jgi:CheY-like chemotaxis protein
MGSSVLNRIRILVADDRAEVRQMARSMLADLGFTNVDSASDGYDAYRKFVLKPASLVITDLEMAPVNGLELIRMIRTGPDSPNRYVPVVVLSCNTDADTVERARDAGVNDILAKPLSINTLYTHIEALVARPQRFVRAVHYFGPDRRRHVPTQRAAERRRVPAAASP